MYQTLMGYLTSDSFFKLATDPQIIALLITIALTFIKWIFQPKARVVWGIQHGFTFSVPQVNAGNILDLHTGSIFVRNEGSASAENVEFYFNSKPEHYQIWPAINYSANINSDNKFVITVPFLKADEYLGIELIQSNIHPPNLLNVRAFNGVCSQVTLAPTKVFPKWFNFTVGLLLLAGLYQLIVWLVTFIQA